MAGGVDLRLPVPPGSYLAQRGVNLTATGSQGQTFQTAIPQSNPFKTQSDHNSIDLNNGTFLNVLV